jgi:hypothetical protein
MEVPSIKMIHIGSVSTDKYEHVFQKPNETAVLVKGDSGPSEDAIQEVNSSSNFLGGYSDDTHRKVEVESKPTNARAHLSLTSNSCSKPPFRSNLVPKTHRAKKSIVSDYREDGVIGVDMG